MFAMFKQQSEVPSATDYYRERAKEMLKKAKASNTEAARAQFLDLAEHWNRMAQKVSTHH